jgi:hypothetical protein
MVIRRTGISLKELSRRQLKMEVVLLPFTKQDER